jgi:DnaK suppressor protein
MPANRHHKHDILRKKLLAEQQELGKRIQGHLGEVFVEYEPDDEAAQATYSITRDMSAATLERERKTLDEIEAALKRIAKGAYGLCESCESAIAEPRLRALPWARLCISCASGGASLPGNYMQMRLRPAH